ncbi:hypothetical protein HMPREF1337_02668 [Enterococcus faecalis ERV65]|uniref:Uncharacterized protein n=1 Tax=Enterococcus faecalis ERV63 TaxID=1134793 RepID=A0AAV3GLY7_ENTFL|nr:hypothetical protein HMPREF1329_02732 [Enterococcus faecalis ERV116]EJU99982.1 hypothetical protein HMPREF1331_01456 [Enterococcus faecalis ERV25]EJV08715.1 hypothetical protein HMPREF1333_00973 [Enterococcus faecalis ERV37]EJV10002.1 hypothetical protein HMPREF1334_01856 [Enterococcus faecalis ERV41]EJV14999.1 hypothetical protein HMPREF1337_02668 [Enterococcus faecalis ERV65]EJV15619.1 hypothetical protein HMPREF1338_02635 [Enterococcus faecalis ERV68]EJV18045.1 hypothetical protein HMPR
MNARFFVLGKCSLATCQISLGNLTEIVKLFCRNDKKMVN